MEAESKRVKANEDTIREQIKRMKEMKHQTKKYNWKIRKRLIGFFFFFFKLFLTPGLMRVGKSKKIVVIIINSNNDNSNYVT